MSMTFLITQLENLVIWGVRMHPGSALPDWAQSSLKYLPSFPENSVFAFVHIPMNQFETATPVSPPGRTDRSDDRVKLLIEVS